MSFPTKSSSAAKYKKLFIAINASDPLSKTFEPSLKKLKMNADKQGIGVKWVMPNNYHVTVVFLGNHSEDKIPQIQEILQQVCNDCVPFELKVDDIGAFATEHEARVIWLDVQFKRVFGELKLKLDEAFREKDLLPPVERGEFSPHLTLGRLRNPRSIKDMISPLKRKSFGKIKVIEVVLYESKMQGALPVYIPLFRCQLLGQDSESNF